MNSIEISGSKRKELRQRPILWHSPVLIIQEGHAATGKPFAMFRAIYELMAKMNLARAQRLCCLVHVLGFDPEDGSIAARSS